jgi:hypothetical protein
MKLFFIAAAIGLLGMMMAIRGRPQEQEKPRA